MWLKIFALSVGITLELGLPVSAKAQVAQEVDSTKQEARNRAAQFISHYVALPEYYIFRHPPLHIPQDAQFARLREEFRERFVGVYVTELYPQHRIAVHLTGHEPVASRKLQFGDDVMIVDFVHGHAHSAADMENAIAAHWGVLARIFPGLQGAGVAGSSGEVILYMDMPEGNAEAMEEMRALAQNILKIPVRIFVPGPERLQGLQ